MSRILLIENDRHMAKGLRYDLEAEGFETVVASDGATGLHKARSGGYDLILLDVMLRGRSGFEVLEELRRSAITTPVILVSARCDEADRVRGLKLGADDFVTRPFALDELLARIRTRTHEARRLAALNDAIARTSHGNDLPTVFSGLLDSALELTAAERGLVLLVDGEGALNVEAARGRDAQLPPSDLKYCTSIARRVLERGEAEALLEADRDYDVRRGGSVVELKLRRVLCAPLHSGRRTVGVLYVDSRVSIESWGRSDLDLFAALADQCALALQHAFAHREKRRLEAEMQAAGTMQQAMQPSRLVTGAAVEIAGLSCPREEAGGDYFDYIPRDAQHLALVIGDAAGHGVAAALCMSAARSLLRAFLSRLDIDGALAEVNEGLCRDLTNTFMTLFLGEVDTLTGELRYAGAGHEATIYRAATRSFEELQPTGPVLGVLPGADYRIARTRPLAPGDLLLLFTDGVPEAVSPGRERFGIERLERLVRDQQHKDADQIVDRVSGAVRHFAGPDGPHDDVSLIVVKGVAINRNVARAG